MSAYHVPVLLAECMRALGVKKDGVYLDGTFGGGGHSAEILRLGGRVIAFDRDEEAIAEATRRLTDEGLTAFTAVHGNFKDAVSVLDGLGVKALDGALLDLGVSSHQIDDPGRGFSYRYDGALDMRMDATGGGITARDVVNGYSEERLTEILFTYGEERYARKIAAAIVSQRRKRPIETTSELSELVKRSTPEFYHRQGHPAKRTFQALRLEVNGELDGLDKAIEDIAGRLVGGGRIAVITFHSLEDRIVKQTLKLLATDCICDKSLPVCVCGHKATVKTLTKIKPTEAELKSNPRAASATLRVAEKL